MGKPMTPRPMKETFADTFFSPGLPLAPSGSIDGIRRIAAFEHGDHISRCGAAHHEARRARSAADVRREQDVWKADEPGVGLRLALEDVQARAGGAPPPGRCDPCR